jgi:hypothetical protein
MGRVIFICCYFFASSFSAKANADTTLHVVNEKNIPGSYTNFYTDNLGNVFLLSKTNQIKKLDERLDSVTVFNDVRRYGNIYSLDVTNPLKIVVYYKDFTTILVLDRFLNIRNTIDLRKYDILEAKAVAQSYDNNYWVFDELDNAIKKIDDNGNILFKSSDFRVLFSDQYDPSYIFDSNGLLYLYDEKKGWLVFDYYGTFKRHIDVTNRKDVQIFKDQIVSHDSNYLYYYNTKTFSEIRLMPDINLSKAIKVQQVLNKIFVLQSDGLSVYSISDNK